MTTDAADFPPAGPLTGVTVVDFTEYIAGPYAAMMLADMGATVLKVEPVAGDHWRRQAPVAPNESRGFIGVNRGKRSVAIDIWQPEGRALAHRLTATADVVLVNYRPGVAVQLGLDYVSLRDRNPGVVYAEITAFGRQGPYREWPGFDLLSQAAAGIMAYENRIEDGVPTGVRTIAPADLCTGMFTAYAVVSALFQRAQTGRGQEVRTSLFGSGIGVQYRPIVSIEKLDAPERAAFLAAVQSARESGLPYEEISRLKRDILGRSAVTNYYRVYQTQDSLVAVACLNNRLRRNLRDLLGVEDPTVDGAMYDSRRLPPEHHLEVRRVMEARFKTRTTAQWLEALGAADVPAAPFLMTEELYDDPHVLANDLIPTYEHAVLGPVRQARMPVEMSEARVGSSLPSPALGSHTEDALLGLGLSVAEIERLEAAGIIARWQPSEDLDTGEIVRMAPHRGRTVERGTQTQGL